MFSAPSGRSVYSKTLFILADFDTKKEATFKFEVFFYENYTWGNAAFLFSFSRLQI